MSKKPYDLSLLEELEDRQQLHEIVDMFLTNTPLQLKELLAAAQKQDWEKVHGDAHKLKGSAGILLADGLVELLKQVEGQTKSQKDPGIINGLLQALLAAWSEIEILLKEEQKKLRGEL